MKRVVFIALLLIAVAAITMIATTCDVFLTPQNGRENPLDPDSPVPAPDGVYAEYVEAEEMVKIYIDLPDDKKNTKGFVTIRKTGSAPTSINDGEEVSRDKWGDVEEAGYIGDTGYKEGKLNYYGVWAYGEDEYEEHFTGPLTTYEGVPLVLEATDDGQIDNADFAEYLINTMQTANWIYAMVKFDLADIESNMLIRAKLKLQCTNVTNAGIIYVNRLDLDWSESSPPTLYSDVQSSYISDSSDFSLSIGSAGEYYADVTHIMREWIWYEQPNHGFLLNEDGSTADVQFATRESSDFSPKLYIYGWEE